MITCNYIKYIQSERKKLKKVYFIKKKIRTLVSVLLMAIMRMRVVILCICLMGKRRVLRCFNPSKCKRLFF